MGKNSPEHSLNTRKKRGIITGAIGMVGGCALRICLENPDVSIVMVIGRGRHFKVLRLGDKNTTS
jgi:hypothetical protein